MEALVGLLVVAVVVLTALYFQTRSEIESTARQQYDQWRGKDRERIILEQREIARREAEAQFAEWRAEQEVEFANWRVENEAAFRQDAIMRSRAVIVGKVTEHITPWLPVFPYNPKDARFVGSPIDLIVFDGCDEGGVRRIIFLEVKSGSSALTKKQRQIRDAVEEGRVEWQELKVSTARDDLPEDYQSADESLDHMPAGN